MGISAVLRDAYRSQTVVTAEGNTIPIRSAVSWENAEILYKRVIEQKPMVAVEIGLAYGMSALAILSAMETVGVGRLISIDYDQSNGWQGVGISAIERAGLSHRHELLEDFDYLALPTLLTEDLRIQFGYVDGAHTFEYVTLDHFYLDKMLEVGGVLGFNDCHMPAVHRSISLLATHRRYKELALDRKAEYQGLGLVNRLLRRPLNDRYFRKNEYFEPVTAGIWDFYRRF